jgi:glycosyltransferase involved in cell wall biosynthesis
MSRFKIVQMLPALGWGGAQVFAIQLCNELIKNPDYDITLVSMYHHTDAHLPLKQLNPRIKFRSLGKHKGFDFKMFGAIKRMIREEKPDVVHTHLHAGYYCFDAFLNVTEFRFKKIHTLHNLAQKESPLHGRLAYNFFFKRKIITPVSISEEVLKSAQRAYDGSAKVLILNGSYPVSASVDYQVVKDKINALKKNRETLVLLNVARICKQKNQIMLLEAMKLLKDENVIAVVLGDYLADDKSIYDELIAAKPENVHFMGKITEVGDYYLNADAFVLTSIFEGLPISSLEAMSAGVIPICTPVGGLINIIKPDIGFLSENLSASSFATAVKKYLSLNSEEIKKLQENNRSLYQQTFSMQSCTAQYDQLYHS